MKFRNLLYLLLAAFSVIPSYAVSDKDMEDAKVIAAKLYLRWTNNASGYLDDVSASSMSDLESKLKTQEKENLKAFKSVNIPADYASWDKQRFVQFWGTTFFTSPALSADGKRARDRVKAKVSTINVSAPTAAPIAEEPKTDAPTAEEQKEIEKPTESQPEPQEGGISIPEPTEVSGQQEAIMDSMAQIQADEQSLALAGNNEKPKSHTWIYVVILIVLVGIVIWLMAYAANMMKRQGKENKEDKGAASGDKKFKKELATLEAENNRLRAQVSQLKGELEKLRSEAKNAKEVVVAPQPPKEESKPGPKIITEIFLGRANPKGLFVRGDRRPNPDYTVFRLNTKDGIVGTFRFAATPEAVELAKSNPLQYLAGGCICENFEEAENASKIITETPGTAILENGCWRVLRKSRIRFE